MLSDEEFARMSLEEQQEYLIDIISTLPYEEKQRVYQQLLLLVGDTK